MPGQPRRGWGALAVLAPDCKAPSLPISHTLSQNDGNHGNISGHVSGKINPGWGHGGAPPTLEGAEVTVAQTEESAGPS